MSKVELRVFSDDLERVQIVYEYMTKENKEAFISAVCDLAVDWSNDHDVEISLDCRHPDVRRPHDHTR